jgi:hypothetical protein
MFENANEQVFKSARAVRETRAPSKTVFQTARAERLRRSSARAGLAPTYTQLFNHHVIV